MISGAVLVKPETVVDDKLGSIVWQRTEEGIVLQSVLQFRPETYKIDGKRKARSALVIHQSLGTKEDIQKVNGTYEISIQTEKQTRWANIFVTSNYIVVDNKSNRTFVKEVINRGLNLPAHTVHYLHLDTAKMAQDFNNHWTRCFEERRGRVQKGTVYGDGVEQDPVFGRELLDSTTKAVGLVTQFFGRQTKVRVSADGTVTVLDFLTPDTFLRYIDSEIMQYKVALPD